jgi:ATP-dependent Zn protease
MNLRRTVRGPITWLVVAVVVVLALLTFTSGSGGYKSEPLSTIENAINNHQVASATLKDKEQQVQVTLTPGTKIDGASKLQSSYTTNYDDTLQTEL